MLKIQHQYNNLNAKYNLKEEQPQARHLQPINLKEHLALTLLLETRCKVLATMKLKVILNVTVARSQQFDPVSEQSTRRQREKPKEGSIASKVEITRNVR